MSYLYRNSNGRSSEQDSDDKEIEQILSMSNRQYYRSSQQNFNRSQSYHNRSIFSQSQSSDNNNRSTDLLNTLFSKISQPTHSMMILQNQLNQYHELPSHSEKLIQNLQKKYSLLASQRDQEGGMSRTSSSMSNSTKQHLKKDKKRIQQSESSEDQYQEAYDYEVQDEVEDQFEDENNEEQEEEEDENLEEDDENIQDEESILEEDDNNQSNSNSLTRYRKENRRQIREYGDSLVEKQNSEFSQFSKEQIEGYMKLEPIEKFAKFKMYKQTFLRTPSLIVRKFLCEVLYDKIEEEKIAKVKYLSKVIGFILDSKEPFNHKFLVKMIEDKDLRVKKIKEVFRVVSEQESIEKNSINCYHSLYRIQKFKDELQNLLEQKVDDKKIQSENKILKDFHERRAEIVNYENNQDFKNLIEQIIIQKTQRICNFSKSSQLIASFLLNSDLSSNFIIKCLQDSERFQCICNSAIDIIRVLSDNHKFEIGQSN